MTDDALALHGGNLAVARVLFPDAPLPWLDLSTGINPVSYPVPRLDPSAWERLPEATDLADLERAAAAAYGARSSAQVFAAPGTQAIIQALPGLLAGRSVGILGPTYAEHAASWRAAGARVEQVETVDRLERFEVAVVVNPNNPDGRLVSVERLRRLAEDLGRKGRQLIVDEAFMDVLDPSCSLIPYIEGEDTLVLRSFGKAYGLGGLRLGFAIGGVQRRARMRAAFGPWAVSGPALAIGRAALRDTAWLERAKPRLGADAEALDRILVRHGLTVAGGTPLFRLTVHAEAPRLFRRLAEAGILVRPFAGEPTWLRFGIPSSEQQRARLAAAL